ncbi:MAG TPA: EAL domain-containing protein [Stellaceae bacterium]|nr:EAL domain-containing protein [Stellaceae bacterium]
MAPSIFATTGRYTIRSNIRNIVLVIGIVIVAIWVLVGFSLVTSRHTALVAASSQSRNLTIAFREEIATILRGVDGETKLIAARMRRDGEGFNLYDWGQENLATSHGIAQVSIIGPDGKLRSTTIERHPPATDLGDRAHFRVQMEGNFQSLFIGQTIRGRLLVGVPLLPISRRVEAPDGTFLGVIVVLIPPIALTTLPKSIDLGPHGTMTLAGLDNVVRARFAADSRDGTKGIGASIAGGPRPAVIAPNGLGWFVRSSVIDGITRVFTYGRVGSYPLVVTVGLDLDHEFAGWRTLAAMVVAMALGATLLLSGLAAYLIRQIYRDATTARAITHTAEHDFLTGLPNRMLLNDRLGQAIALGHRHQGKVAVLFLDLDGFKHINDSLGHPIGDKLLQSIAQRLKDCVRESDTVSRQGGDEFIVLLSEIQRVEDIAVTTRRCLAAVAEVHTIDQRELHVTTSIGVSVYPDDALDAATLIKNADTAMYQAKENGRQGYQFFTPAMNVRAVQRLFIEEGLRDALKGHEFALHYQPKIDLKSGAITGAEALLRWTHPTRGAVPPAIFIPVAEDCGLILPIGNWVLREACAQTRAWRDAGLPVTPIAINISAVEFRAENFLENLFAVLREAGLDPGSLEIELTESVLMKHAESAAAILRALRDGGVRVAIDDFGTGYSSLSYLRNFPVDALKIDQSFVRRITTHRGDEPLVTAIIAMARSLSLRVVAEGVETLEELEFLRARHCDEAQGYYFSRPVPAAAFANILRCGLPPGAGPAGAPARAVVPVL